jgi:hypothetical protein
VPGHETAAGPPVPEVDATSFETDRSEDYEVSPYEDAWVDVLPTPENPPAKRLRTAYKATAVSSRFEQSCPFTDYILRKKNALEDLVSICDILLLELCRHEGLRGLATDSSGFPLCGGCGTSSPVKIE